MRISQKIKKKAIAETPPIYIERCQGEHFAVLYRPDENAPAGPCPFCGKTHLHGDGDGHRAPHCVEAQRRAVELEGGIVISARDGYLVKTGEPDAGMLKTKMK
jgi:hypothetical protein